MAQYKFVEWLSVSGNPQYVEECIVLKTFPNNEKAFINIKQLDKIDLSRMKTFITSRAATLHNDLATLLAEQVLDNGVNALTYFHQLTKILSPNGTVRSANSGKILATPQESTMAPAESLGSSQPMVNESIANVSEPSFEQVAAKPATPRK